MKISPALELHNPQASLVGSLWARLRAVWDSVNVHRRIRRLHLCESVSLGEKRLIAVVEFEDQRFLLAATSESITLLQSLGAAAPTGEKPSERA